MKVKKLEPKQELFCLEYIKDYNGTRAAKTAGFGTTDKSSQVAASKLLSKGMVKERVDELKREQQKRLQMSADDVLIELSRLATTDIAKCYDANGHLKPIHEIPQEIRVAIESIEVFEEFEGLGKERHKIGETKRIKFWSKPKALELMGKHHKQFTDKVEHSGQVTLAQLVTGSMDEDEK